jgi:KH/beta-lactamase-domain protein
MSILKELTQKLPKDAEISEVKFEGSEIVLYTKNKEFFRRSESLIRDIVKSLKKRVEIRPDLSITMEMEKAKAEIMKMVPESAGVKAVYFEPELGKVVIESQKPGLVIGKGGETFREIRDKTLWLPKIERAPAIDSDIVRAVRNLLHSEIPYRKKFLNTIGQKINEEIEKKAPEEWVRLSTLGGFKQVGRSSLFIQTPYSSVLLDCGIDVGNDSTPYLDAPEFKMDKLDAVVLSHAHLDHCGYIPYLFENGYTGPLYCTAPTRDLMVLLCMDFIDVCQKNGKNVPYKKSAIEKAVKHSIALEYGEVSDITRDMRLTFQPSGHLLGSSLVHLHVGEGLHNILYTGDLKFGPSKLFEPAYTGFQRVETLIIESTYGAAGDRWPTKKECEDKLIELVTKTVARGGKVLIPSFAVGRAQEVMAILADSKDINFPVYIEGMLWDATAIHTAYPEYLSNFMQRQIFHYGKNPFLSDVFKNVAPKERNNIIDSGEPGVIIATSGMLIGGPAIEYLKGLAHDPKNLLLFVGYQAEGTMGRRIQKGWREIPIYAGGGKNKVLEMKMEVDTIDGLSGHSDRAQLTSFIHKLPRPERIIINHGEAKKSIEFSRDIHRMLHCETLTPKNLEVIRLK